jgi:hypothetical protein
MPSPWPSSPLPPNPQVNSCRVEDTSAKWLKPQDTCLAPPAPCHKRVWLRRRGGPKTLTFAGEWGARCLNNSRLSHLRQWHHLRRPHDAP